MSLSKALFEVQKEGIELQKNAINPHFKNTYITLDAVLEGVLPVLQKHGILVIQAPDQSGPNPALTTELILAETGESVKYTCPMVLDRVSPQAVGSAITYYRRYALLSVLGLVADEDDDAESAGPGKKVKPEVVKASERSRVL